MRRFIGRWLDDRLRSGPDAGLRTRLIEQLARQGWRLREPDSVLAISDPVRGIPGSSPFLRASRLHPLIEAEAVRAASLLMRILDRVEDQLLATARQAAGTRPG